MRKKILIVEDEENIIELLSLVFKFEDNYQILRSNNGEEALKKAEEEAPDIIILDMQIPGINGIEVCRFIKSNPITSDIKILMLTGMSQTSDLEKAQEAGADVCKTKPFDTNILTETVKKLLNSDSES